MTKAVVRYNNGLNAVPLRKFTPVEMDLFWSICAKMKRKKMDIEVFDFDEIRELSKFSVRGEIFADEIIKMADKLSELSFYFEDEHVWEKLMLFQRFRVDKDNKTLTVQASERFEFILNTIGSNFTRFELENMTQLDSSYTKELYRQLMSHKDNQTKKGAWFVTVEDFRTILSVPESYRMADIDKRIFNQAKREFLQKNAEGNSIFSKFEVIKIKAKKGNKIQSFQIYFQEPKPLKVSMHNWLND